MSLVDDMKEIAGNSLQTLTVTGAMVCVFCGLPVCRRNCVRHSIPAIVAALEAADRFIDRGGEDDREEWIALSEAFGL